VISVPRPRVLPLGSSAIRKELAFASDSKTYCFSEKGDLEATTTRSATKKAE
jgi:hypothetical protein